MDEHLDVEKLMKEAYGTQKLSPEYLAALAVWMSVFGEVYGKILSDLQIATYRETLKDLTVKQLNRGCAQAIRFHVYANVPTPAEIRQYAEGQTGDQCYAQKQEPTVCEKCKPDGWRLVPGDSKSKWPRSSAVRCDHR